MHSLERFHEYCRLNSLSSAVNRPEEFDPAGLQWIDTARTSVSTHRVAPAFLVDLESSGADPSALIVTLTIVQSIERYSQQSPPRAACGNLENLNLLTAYTGGSRRPAVMNTRPHHSMVRRRFSAAGCALLQRILRYCQTSSHGSAIRISNNKVSLRWRKR